MVFTIGCVSLSEVTNAELRTPLKITFQSKAKTKMNGTVYQLKKDDPAPIIIDDLNSDLVLDFEFKTGTSLRLKLFWVPLNVGRVRQPNDDSENLLLHLFNRNIDLRIIKDFQKVTHVLTSSDAQQQVQISLQLQLQLPTLQFLMQPSVSFELAIALLRGVNIVGSEWPKFVLDHITRFEKWLDQPPSVLLLPSTSRMDVDATYYLPNPKRKTLLDNIVIFSVVKSDKSDYSLLLQAWIKGMGGILIDLANIRDDKDGIVKRINEESKDYGSYFLLGGNKQREKDIVSSVCKELHILPISLSQLFDSLVLVNTDNLIKAKQPKDLPKTQAPDETPTGGRSLASASASPKKRRLGDRRSKKVDKLAFFDFSSMPTQKESTKVTSPIKPLVPSFEPSVVEEVSNPTLESVQPGQVPESDAIFDDNQLNDYKKRSNDDNDNENDSNENENNKRIKLDETLGKKHDLEEDNDRSSIEIKRFKLENKAIGPFIPKVALKDAIQQTKTKATDAVREVLGINSDDINEKLTNLAIIELVDLLKTKNSRVKSQAINPAWSGKKNFKQFKKNIPLKSRVSRSFVDMDVVNADARIPGKADMKISLGMQQELEIENRSRKQVVHLAHDFDGVMENINGYNPRNVESDNENDSFSFLERPNEGLFVPEDSQPVIPTNNEVNSNKIQRQLHIDSESESEDDDQPKFGFRRKY